MHQVCERYIEVVGISIQFLRAYIQIETHRRNACEYRLGTQTMSEWYCVYANECYTELNETNLEMQKLNQTYTSTKIQIEECIVAYLFSQFSAETRTYAVICAIFGRRNAQNPFEYFLDTQNKTNTIQYITSIFYSLFLFVFLLLSSLGPSPSFSHLSLCVSLALFHVFFLRSVKKYTTDTDNASRQSARRLDFHCVWTNISYRIRLINYFKCDQNCIVENKLSL